MTLHVDLTAVEEAAKLLYIRALKVLPTDIKQGFERLMASETDATGKTILGTMVENIAVAERTRNLLCQDTGIPIYNVTIGRDVRVDGIDLRAAIVRGTERATREHPLRSSVVHPITRKNEQTSCGVGIPIIHVDFDDRDETPKTSSAAISVRQAKAQPILSPARIEGNAAGIRIIAT